MSEVATKELSEKWVQGQIKDLVTIRNGFAFKSKDFNDESGVPVIRQTNLSTRIANFCKPKYLPDDLLEEFEDYKINKGDVLIGLSGSIGNLSRYMANEPALQNQRTGLLVEQVPGSIKYVEYYLQLIKKDLLGAGKGVAVQNISSKAIENWSIPIAPLEQQKRIVAKIEELFSHIDAGIEALKKAKQLLKQYRQSVLKAAVTGELTKEWREANKGKLEPASQLLERIEGYRNQWIEDQIEKGSSEANRLRNKLKRHEFDEIEEECLPEEWASVSLLELCLAVVDCHNKTAPYVEDGIPLIRTSNIRHGVINFREKMKYVNEETYDYWSRRCPPEPGDILFTREAPMGESAIVPEGTKVCMGQRMMLLRIIHEFTDVDYLHIALMEPLFQRRFQNFKVGVGVQHLRVGDVERSVIAIPSLEEQKEIVSVANERLDSIKRLESDIILQLKKAEKNKQSVLASAFSGGLKG